MLRVSVLLPVLVLAACGGSEPAPAPEAAPAAPAKTAPAKAEPAAAAKAAAAPDGEAIYNQYCVACHGADGKGNNGLGGSYAEVLPGKTDAELIASIKNGKTSATGAAMPPWGGTLKDDQIKAVLEYVKGKYGPKAE
jgi:cytochrome c oxidase cbb3-type subunit 3